MLENAVSLSARAPWLGRALVWGFIVAVCVGLVWGCCNWSGAGACAWFPRNAARLRAQPPPSPGRCGLRTRAAPPRPASGARPFTSLLGLHLAPGVEAPVAGRPRPHPREYLALVAADDARRPDLATLTGSFERVWYGGRTAEESDYQRAEQIANALISGSGSAGGAG